MSSIRLPPTRGGDKTATGVSLRRGARGRGIAQPIRKIILHGRDAGDELLAKIEHGDNL